MAVYATWSETLFTGGPTDVTGAALALSDVDVLVTLNLGLKCHDASAAAADAALLVPFIKNNSGTKVWEGEALYLNGNGWVSVTSYFKKSWMIKPALVGIAVSANFYAGFEYYESWTANVYYAGTAYY